MHHDYNLQEVSWCLAYGNYDVIEPLSEQAEILDPTEIPISMLYIIFLFYMYNISPCLCLQLLECHNFLFPFRSLNVLNKLRNGAIAQYAERSSYCAEKLKLQIEKIVNGSFFYCGFFQVLIFQHKRVLTFSQRSAFHFGH